MQKLLLSTACLLALALCATSAFAIVYIVPTDRDLAKRAEAIVIATAGESHAEMNSRGAINTVAEMQVESVLKGTVGATVQLVEPGGILSERATIIPGSPRYEAGKRYLVFLRKTNDGDWATYGFQLGQFELGTDLRGRDLAVRAGGESLFGLNEADGSPYTDRYRSLPEFLDSIRSANANTPNYFIERSDILVGTFPPLGRQSPTFVPAPQATRPDYLMPNNYRWKNGGTASFGYCCPGNYPTAFGSNPINASGAASSAVTNWSVSGTTVHYTLSGENTSATHGFTAVDSINGILFNDPHNEVPSGAVAIGGIENISGNYSDLGDGFTYNNTIEGDVVVEKNSLVPTFVNQALFAALLTHEVGHTLGFRHSDQTADGSAACTSPSPCASPGSAVMAHIVQSPALSLQQWDRDAVNTVYGSGSTCTAPSITRQPSDSTIIAGQQASLNVIAAGTATLNYLWYTGTPPSGPVAPGPNNNGATYNPSPPSTTTYWVRVSNSCGTIDSTTATVTVNPACPTPTITVQPTGSTINSGQQAQLSVTANGGSPSYQWYVGSPPNTSSPVTVNGNGPSLTVSPTTTTTYWVQVTNSCGPTNSNAATVTVNPPCSPPFVVNEPQDQTVTSGSSAQLFVGYSGSTSLVTWYQGVKPDTSHQIGTGQSVPTGPLTTQTQFWASIANSCGSTQSRTVTISVTTSCVAPNITLADATPHTVAPGGTITLTAQATGTSLQYQWYRGTPPDVSNPVAGGNTPTATDVPPASGNYFVRVSNGCGSQDSSAIAITVTTSCIPPTITGVSSDPTISSNTSVALAVTATGDTPLHYQWYRGPAGNTANPVGTDSPTFTSQPLFADARFWVKVSSACTPFASSRTINVTVLEARHRAARH